MNRAGDGLGRPGVARRRPVFSPIRAPRRRARHCCRHEPAGPGRAVWPSAILLGVAAPQGRIRQPSEQRDAAAAAGRSGRGFRARRASRGGECVWVGGGVVGIKCGPWRRRRRRCASRPRTPPGTAGTAASAAKADPRTPRTARRGRTRGGQRPGVDPSTLCRSCRLRPRFGFGRLWAGLFLRLHMKLIEQEALKDSWRLYDPARGNAVVRWE